jgi:hypothetical protein
MSDNDGVSDPSIWRSDGDGKTWVKALLQKNFEGTLWAPKFILAAGDYLFMDWGAGTALGRSADGGDNWTNCSPPGTDHWYAMAAQPGGSKIIVLEDYGKVHVSSDYGDTWSGAIQMPGWVSTGTGVVYWPYNNRLYVFGDSGQNGIYTSTDGTSWNLLRYRANAVVDGTGYQLLGIFFPSDPAKPPWGVANGPRLLRGQMVNGQWNGCWDGEVWVDPASGNNPSGTAVSYLPGSFTSTNPYLIFHDDRIIAFGQTNTATFGVATCPISYLDSGTPIWSYPSINSGLDFGMAWMDPNNHAYIWASEVTTDGNSSSLGGIWRSVDGGQTWNPSNTGIEKCSLNITYYGRPLLVSANTPHDSVPVKPTAPVITAVTDLDPTVFSGLTVTYTPGQAALRHDLYRDGVLAVSSYNSGDTYRPPDRQSHSYVVRAVNDAGYTDSNAMSGADLSVPAITSIDDLSPCAQTGIHINYLGDPAALRHDLVRDGSVVVTGYVSGALYNPADTVSHTYIIRAVYSNTTADSNSLAFADANNTPGKPVITQIGDRDPSYLTGVEVNFTPGSGATSHDLYVDSTLVRRNISSGYIYKPGDEAQHSYVVRAYNGACYADSAPVLGRDMGIVPPPMAAGTSRVVLHYDLQARAWHEVENSSPVRGYFWDHHRRVMRVWNGSTTGVAAQRGGSQFVEIDVAQLALGNSVALKRLRHVEVDLTYDEVTLTCEFYIDGQPVPVTVPQTVLPRGYKVMGETTGPDAAVFSEDGSGGAFDEPHRQVLRFPCPAGGRGKVLGAKITGTVQGFGRVDDVRLAFSEV